MTFQGSSMTRSRALSSVPERKINNALERTVESCDEDRGKPINAGLCKSCRAQNAAIMRYAESNIPVEYWSLTMEEHFQGFQGLMDKYSEIVGNLTESYEKGRSIIFSGANGCGKQLSLDTELPTPNGFVKLLDLKKGDELFDENGNICKVIRLHPIDLLPESYEIEFDDGTKVEACADHLWLTCDKKSRQNNTGPKIRTTKEILNSLRAGINQVANHSIPCIKPINYSEKDLPIDPYVFGCWLGDGSSYEGLIECADKEILLEIEKVGYSINRKDSTIRDISKSCAYRVGDLVEQGGVRGSHKIGLLTKQLKELKLLKNSHASKDINCLIEKYIPKSYLYSSYKQRLSLVQGLMDTDGCCSKRGSIEFCSVYKILAEQVLQLLLSLGIKAKINKNKSYLYNQRCKDRYRIAFTTQMPVFRLQRKLSNIRSEKAQINRTTHRYIINVKRIDPKPMRCITVDSPSHLYLITRSFIPTHNTMTCSCILRCAAQAAYTCQYTTLGDIVNLVSTAPSDEKYNGRRELMGIDFLVIDEFDPRWMATDKAADLYGRTLEDIFRARLQNKLPTLMCTNSSKVTDSFSGPLKKSIESLMHRMETVSIPATGFSDFRGKGKATK